jgi:hypothetical protein
MKIQCIQVFVVIFTMCYLSGCERNDSRENNRLIRESMKELTQEVRKVKSDLVDTNIKLIDIKIELNRFHMDSNTHNLKVQRKML